MIGRDLITTLRDRVDDGEKPYKWFDNELLRNLNYAEEEACRRAHLIIDDTIEEDYGTAGTFGAFGTAGTFANMNTYPLCQVVISANVAVYTISRKVLQIRRCQLGSMTYPLIGPVTYNDLDNIFPEWKGTAGEISAAGSGGKPAYFLNEPNNVLTLVLAPSVADIAYLVVSRLPLMQFTFATSPEVEEQYHMGLIDWAAHLCFLKPNESTYNPTLATYYSDMFTRKFGPPVDAYVERMRKTINMQGRMRARPFGS
jgi:hypothetical protein